MRSTDLSISLVSPSRLPDKCFSRIIRSPRQRSLPLLGGAYESHRRHRGASCKNWQANSVLENDDQRGTTRRILSRSAPQSPRPSQLLVVTLSEPSGPITTSRRRPASFSK